MFGCFSVKLAHKVLIYKVDNKSEKSLIRHLQKYMLLMKVTNILRVSSMVLCCFIFILYVPFDKISYNILSQHSIHPFEKNLVAIEFRSQLSKL